MDNKIQFVNSIRQDIHSFQSSTDLSLLSRNDFRLTMVRKIVGLSKKYDLQSITKVPISQNEDRIAYIDVIWLMESVPLVAFDINTSFRISHVWKLKNFEVPYRNYVFFGKLSQEQVLTLKAIDDTNVITVLEFPEFNRRQLKKGKSKKKRTREGVEDIVPESRTKKARSTSPKLTPSLKETYTLFKKGYSLNEIATKRELTVGTIVQHLARVMQSGEYVDLSSLVTSEKQAAILSVSDRLGTKRFSPIKEVLGEDYSWDEIRLVLARNERYDLFE